ncbi:MAG: restriction endonuclease subunit S [Pseudomonadota bacterium]
MNDMSELSIKPLGEIAITFAGGTPSRSVQEFFEGNIPWVKSTEVNQSSVEKTKEHISENAVKYSSVKWAKKGSVLVAMYGATAGQISELKINATTNQAVLAIDGYECISNKFLYYYLINAKGKLLYLAQGSGQPNLSKALVDSLVIKYPALDKQNKISKILATLDQVIEKTRALIDKHTTIKQGMMADLFTRGVDLSTGQLRPIVEQAPHLYKETELGWLPKDWGFTTLYQLIARLESGVSVNSDETSDYFSEKQILKTSSLSGCVFNPSEAKKIVAEDIERVDLYVKEDSILISRMNTPNLVGENAYISKDYLALFIPDRIWQTVPNKTIKYSVKWLSNVLSSQSMRESISGLATGTSGSMKNISKPSFLSLALGLPEYDEQLKQLDIIEKEESFIGDNKRLLDKYKSIKAGLMNDLLTGKVSV